jgi:peptidoglycan/xylan/chitin deacetylase (PgdA/CDA1 family)
VLKKAEINSTWCVIPPGYPEELIGAIREAGHELAMHYDAMSDGTVWSEKEFSKQHRGLVKLFGGERPITNKNHYLRWEGDTEFFEWLIKHGIQFDQSKGATKTGEAGFNFGACHPYLPIDPNGETIDVLELPTITQDLLVFAPKELADLLLAAVLKHHGILHLLFHPAHIEKPGIAEVLLEVIEKAKRHGMEWWPACRINSWERARRNVCWSKLANANVLLRTPDPLPGASIMRLTQSAAQVKVNGEILEPRIVERWGFRFLAVTFDAETDGQYRIEITDKEK